RLIDGNLKRTAHQRDRTRILFEGSILDRHGAVVVVDHVIAERRNVLDQDRPVTFRIAYDGIPAPTKWVVDDGPPSRAADSICEQAHRSVDDMLCQAQTALVRMLPDKTTQTFTLVVVVVLRREQFAPRFFQFPGRVYIPAC